MNDIKCLSDTLVEYLRERWPDAAIRTHGADIEVSRADCEYKILLDPDLAEENDGPAFRQLLQQWDLTGELKRAEGMPMILTKAGVRLASSN